MSIGVARIGITFEKESKMETFTQFANPLLASLDPYVSDLSSQGVSNIYWSLGV